MAAGNEAESVQGRPPPRHVGSSHGLGFRYWAGAFFDSCLGDLIAEMALGAFAVVVCVGFVVLWGAYPHVAAGVMGGFVVLATAGGYSLLRRRRRFSQQPVVRGARALAEVSTGFVLLAVVTFGPAILWALLFG
jgi:hypothetical protein